MNTSIQSTRTLTSTGPASLIDIVSSRIRDWRRRLAGRRQLARLDDHLRRDIGLPETGNTRPSPRAMQREHEIRFKIWTDRSG